MAIRNWWIEVEIDDRKTENYDRLREAIELLDDIAFLPLSRNPARADKIRAIYGAK